MRAPGSDQPTSVEPPFLRRNVNYGTRLTQRGLFEGPARHLARIVHILRCDQNVEEAQNYQAGCHVTACVNAGF